MQISASSLKNKDTQVLNTELVNTHAVHFHKELSTWKTTKELESSFAYATARFTKSAFPVSLSRNQNDYQA